MPQLCADREPSFPVQLALFGRQILGPRTTCCRCRPSGEFPVADLRVLVSMPVDAVHACRCALVFEAPQLLDVASVCRNEAAPACQSLGFIEHQALLVVADRDLAGAAALGPGVLQRELVAPILIDSPRRRPNAACSRRDIAV